jgi:hypothetical protein
MTKKDKIKFVKETMKYMTDVIVEGIEQELDGDMNLWDLINMTTQLTYAQDSAAAIMYKDLMDKGLSKDKAIASIKKKYEGNTEGLLLDAAKISGGRKTTLPENVVDITKSRKNTVH